jgi:hypothetical protein
MTTTIRLLRTEQTETIFEIVGLGECCHYTAQLGYADLIKAVGSVISMVHLYRDLEVVSGSIHSLQYLSDIAVSQLRREARFSVVAAA